MRVFGIGDPCVHHDECCAFSDICWTFRVDIVPSDRTSQRAARERALPGAAKGPFIRAIRLEAPVRR